MATGALAEWDRVTTTITSREAELPVARETLERAIQADEEHLRKNGARLQDLMMARKQALDKVTSIDTELAQLPAQLAVLLTSVERDVGAAVNEVATQWIQAKALMEVLAPQLGVTVRSLEDRLSHLQVEVSTPGRSTAHAWTSVDDAFAYMLAEARSIVIRLTGEWDHDNG